MSAPSETTVHVWTRLIRAHKAAMAHVESALKRSKMPPLIWYDALLVLERAGADGLRPYEMEDALLLPQYGVSRLVERLAKEGYLQRINCEDDGRGQSLVITPTGLDLRQKMWTVYGPAIEDAVGKKLTAEDAQLLANLLPKLFQ
jgi:DNA-binding MarR family transcriptional regulator